MSESIQTYIVYKFLGLIFFVFYSIIFQYCAQLYYSNYIFDMLTTLADV
jgi:hypothetical protein